MVAETASYSQELDELSRRLDEIYYEFEDISSSIRDCRDSAVFSPEELDFAIARLEVINKLKAKHGMSVEELLNYQQELDEKLAGIENADSMKESLETDLAKY